MPDSSVPILLVGANLRSSALIAGVALILTLSMSPVAQAALPEQPPRWVLADDLRVRAGPGPERKVIGTLRAAPS